jgi:thiamine biosynthesis protein ThiS
MDFAEAKTIGIVLNGEPRNVPADQNIEQLLRFLEIDPARVAVEFNRSIIGKSGWVAALVQEGDQLEVVWFVGGG